MEAVMAGARRYEVISRDLTDQIASGRLKPGQRLESETNLATHYGVSRMTVRQALGQLESDELVARRHGSGTFVTEHRGIKRRANRLAPFHEELGLAADDISTSILLREVGQPPEEITRVLFSTSGPTAVHIVRLRSYRGRPIAIQDSWIPYLLAPQLAHGRLIQGSLYKTLAAKSGVEIAWAEQQVTAAVATEELAATLQIQVGSPLLRTNRVSRRASGDIVEVAECVMLPEFPTVFRLER
jgi:GntR family transcriptional regulator